MSVLTSGFGSSEQPQYQISRSLRFNSADSAYLTRTLSVTSNRKTWTWSGWIKRANFSECSLMFVNDAIGGTPRGGIGFSSDGSLNISFNYTGNLWQQLFTSQVFRDTSAWYHIIVAIDTTQATDTNRIKLYVNGLQVTSFSSTSYPAQNTDTPFNTTYTYYIGAASFSTGLSNGYMTEVNFIDGQALTPSSFGEFDNTTGVWKPKKYTGTYGTNGFYLNFSDNSNTTATTLGKDSSGNNNNWTPNNFSVTAGAGNDSMVDTPTPYGTDTGVGGQVRGNYCTLNPLVKSTNTSISNGNLYIANTSTSPFNQSAYCTIPVSSGKWYFEVLSFSNFVNGQAGEVGITLVSNSLQDRFSTNSNAYTFGFGYGIDKWYKRSNNVFTQLTLTGATSGITVMRVAVDLDNGKMWVAKDSSWENSGNPASGTNPTFDSIPTGLYVFGATAYKDVTLNIDLLLNFGQRPFAYTAPSGFKALCTTNLPEPTIKKGAEQFNVVTYTGNGGTNSVTGVGFSPGLTWFKSRSAATDNALYDTVRGATKQLESNTATQETTESTGLTSFDSNGFTLGSLAQLNQGGVTYVGWNWKGGGTAVTNTQGTITSQVSANPSAGFSIVTYTGTNTTGTVGHSLGLVPSMIIAKTRDTTASWVVYHRSIGATKVLFLGGYAEIIDSRGWNNTIPTSSVFSVSIWTNYLTGGQLAYCFAEIPGYSAFGSYTGNGSTDGPFVYLGFRPRFILLKVTNTTGNWTILDAAREGYNVDNDPLYPNLSDAEGTTDLLDILSNGFKLRTTDASVNGNTNTYIYAAFSENPFKYALAR